MALIQSRFFQIFLLTLFVGLLFYWVRVNWKTEYNRPLKLEFSYEMGKVKDGPETFDLSDREVDRKILKADLLKKQKEDKTNGINTKKGLDNKALPKGPAAPGNLANKTDNKQKPNQKNLPYYSPPLVSSRVISESNRSGLKGLGSSDGLSGGLTDEENIRSYFFPQKDLNNDSNIIEDKKNKTKTKAEWEAHIEASLKDSNSSQKVAIEFITAYNKKEISDNLFYDILSSALTKQNDNLKQKFAITVLKATYTKNSFEILVHYKDLETTSSQIRDDINKYLLSSYSQTRALPILYYVMAEKSISDHKEAILESLIIFEDTLKNQIILKLKEAAGEKIDHKLLIPKNYLNQFKTILTSLTNSKNPINEISTQALSNLNLLNEYLDQIKN